MAIAEKNTTYDTHAAALFLQAEKQHKEQYDPLIPCPECLHMWWIGTARKKNWWSSPVISGLPIFLVPGSQQCIPWKRKMCPALLARFCLNESKICNTQLFKLTIKKLSSKINGKNITSNRHKNCQATCSARRGAKGENIRPFFLRNCFPFYLVFPPFFEHLRVRVITCVCVRPMLFWSIDSRTTINIQNRIIFFLWNRTRNRNAVCCDQRWRHLVI